MDFDSIPSELQDKTDAEIAAVLPLMTSKPILKAKVEKDLRDNELAWFGSDGWEGPIADLRISSNPAVTDEFKKGIRFFLGFLRATDDPDISTDGVQYAIKTWQILQGLKGIAPVVGTFTFGDSNIDNFYSLAGGRPWKNEDKASIAAARQALEKQKVFHVQYVHTLDAFLSPAELSGDKAQLTQAYRDAADWLESQ